MDKELKTIINLEQSTYAHGFQDEELIHKNEFERVGRLIEKQLSLARAWSVNKKSRQPHYYNTISVFGERGTGKTSFLHSVLDDVTDKYNDVEILGIIDPTLIEEKEHIFILVVSMINEHVCAALKSSECKVNTKAFEHRKIWNEKLMKLAKGLPTLEKLGTDHRTEKWQSHEFIMERGLNEVYSAYTLEEDFHSLVACALEILDKRAFMLALDDIDVDMKKGWDVLEMLRKYITTPQIITLLSGNLKLYSLNIRKQQWGQLTVNKRNDEKKDYVKLVNELEGQFLLKVLKSENRIHLYTLLESIQLFSINYEIDGYGDKRQHIKDVYRDILNRLGIKGETQREIYENYLLSLSIRSQIQFMLNNKDVGLQGIESVEAFLSRLYAANVDVDLAVNNVQMLNIIIQKYLEEQESTPELYLLMPNYADEDKNACLTAFTILFCNAVKTNPFLVFDFFIRMGYIRNVVLGLDYYYSVTDFYNHIGLGQMMSLKNNVGLSIAYCLGHDSQMNSHIPLYALAGKSKKDRTKSMGRIDYEVESAANQAQSVMAYLPLSILRFTDKNETRLYYSFYSLMAVIGEILKISQNDNQKEAVKALMMNFQLLRTYPTWTREGDMQSKYVDEPSSERNYSEEIEVKKSEGDKSLEKLADAIVKWSKQYKENIPPYLIGKIATRLYYTLQKIREANLGEQMHRSVIAFWNACLIEETTEYYVKTSQNEGIEKLNLSNAITKDKLFFDNVDFVLRNRAFDKIKLTDWMLKCPLLWAFANVEVLKSQTFQVRVNPAHHMEVYPFENGLDPDYSVYGILKSVRLKDAPLVDFTAAKDKIQKTIAALERIEFDISYILDKENEEEEIANDLNEAQIFRNRVTRKMIRDFRSNYPQEFDVDSKTVIDKQPDNVGQDTDTMDSSIVVTPARIVDNVPPIHVSKPLSDAVEEKEKTLKQVKKIVVIRKGKK